MVAPCCRISYPGNRICKQLNFDRSVLSLRGDGPYFRHSIHSGHVIGEPQVLFAKIFPLNLVTGLIRHVAECAMSRVSQCCCTHRGRL